MNFNNALDFFAKNSQPSVIYRSWQPYRPKLGRPMTKWNGWLDRKLLEKQSNGLIPYPAKASFSTPDEAAIILAYGAYLEYHQEVELYHELSLRTHRLGLLKMENDDIVAIAKLSLPNHFQAFRIRERTIAKIRFSNPLKSSSRDVVFSAISVPNVLNLPFRSDSIFIILEKPTELLLRTAVNPSAGIKWRDCQITITVPMAGAQRQVDSINRLCEGQLSSLKKWHRLLLNQHAGPRKIYDPTLSSGLSTYEIDGVIRGVLYHPKLDWSEDQKSCIKAVRRFPERLLMIEGFPGTGKTYTLAAMASIFLSLGLHVLVSAPTHAAGDAFSNTMDKYNADANGKWVPIRVYRPVSELQLFKVPEAPDDSESDSESDWDDLPTNAKDASEAANAQSDDSDPIDISTMAQELFLQLAQETRKDQSARSYGLPERSLQAKVVSEAQSSKLCVGPYPGRSTAPGNVDIFSEVRWYLEKLRENPVENWSTFEQGRSSAAFRKAAGQVIRDARFIVSTSNNVASDFISSNFGHEAKGIIIFRNEDPKEIEVNSWIPVTETSPCRQGGGHYFSR